MRVYSAAVLIALCAVDTVAQRAAPASAMRGHPGGAAPARGRAAQRAGFGFPFLAGYDPYDAGYTAMPYTAPQTVIVEAAPVIVPPPPPPRVPQAVIHTYAPEPAATAEAPSFAIAATDGSRIEAAAVWVQKGMAHYIDPEGRALEIPLASIDRNLTRKLNAERNLTLRLPPQ